MLGDMKNRKDEQTSQRHAAIEVTLKSDEMSSAAKIPARKVQHLDVDEILARSLPKLERSLPRTLRQ